MSKRLHERDQFGNIIAPANAAIISEDGKKKPKLYICANIQPRLKTSKSLCPSGKPISTQKSSWDTSDSYTISPNTP